MTQVEAMKLAREVIQDYIDEYGPHEKDSGAAYTLMKLDQAIEQAQKQEPVGRFAKFTDGVWREVTATSAGQPLYTSPQRCQNCASLEAQNTELDAKLANYEKGETNK